MSSASKALRGPRLSEKDLARFRSKTRRLRNGCVRWKGKLDADYGWSRANPANRAQHNLRRRAERRRLSQEARSLGIGVVWWQEKNNACSVPSSSRQAPARSVAAKHQHPRGRSPHGVPFTISREEHMYARKLDALLNPPIVGRTATIEGTSVTFFYRSRRRGCITYLTQHEAGCAAARWLHSRTDHCRSRVFIKTHAYDLVCILVAFGARVTERPCRCGRKSTTERAPTRAQQTSGHPYHTQTECFALDANGATCLWRDPSCW